MLLIFLPYLFFVILLLLGIPILFLGVEVFAALMPATGEKKIKPKEARPPTTILIPAHNEEHGIKATLEVIAHQMLPQDQLLVVADNCSDRTAIIARDLGAIVLERNDDNHRGKGYALDFGLTFLKNNPPEVIIICDADISILPDTLEKLIWCAHIQQQPVQAKYILHLPSEVNARVRISAFAFFFKNFVRPLGLSRLGGGCLLTGTGMAFPWNLIKDAPLASRNIVEDMQLGIDLAIAGKSPMFCPDAVVISEMAPDSKSHYVQRTRWEHGHMLTIRTQVTRLIWQSFKQRRLDLLLLGGELAVPPLASLVILLCGVFCVTIILTMFQLLPVCFVAGVGGGTLVLFISILFAWLHFGKEILSFQHLLAIPFYLIYKMPIYISFLVRPKKEWVRTSREFKDKNVPNDTEKQRETVNEK